MDGAEEEGGGGERVEEPRGVITDGHSHTLCVYTCHTIVPSLCVSRRRDVFCFAVLEPFLSSGFEW